MTDRELIQMALDALDSDNPDIQLRAAVALRTRLAQPEQEPVAWMCPDDPDRETAFSWQSGHCVGCGKQRVPVYTTPQQRPWVGLTDEEIKAIAATPAAIPGSYVHSVARAISDKLKEKNT